MFVKLKFVIEGLTSHWWIWILTIFPSFRLLDGYVLDFILFARTPDRFSGFSFDKIQVKHTPQAITFTAVSVGLFICSTTV
jgi:hypothetical protein